MKILNVAHPSYMISDLDRSLRFYRDILGIRQKFQLFHDEKVWITYLEVAPHQYVELICPAGPCEKATFALRAPEHIGYLHLALEVDDLDAWREFLRGKDVKIVTEPAMGEDHARQMWIEDPDGNSIELMEYGKDSMQMQD